MLDRRACGTRTDKAVHIEVVHVRSGLQQAARSASKADGLSALRGIEVDKESAGRMRLYLPSGPMQAGTLNGGIGLSRSTTTAMPTVDSFCSVERVPERTSSTGINGKSPLTVAPL